MSGRHCNLLQMPKERKRNGFNQYGLSVVLHETRGWTGHHFYYFLLSSLSRIQFPLWNINEIFLRSQTKVTSPKRLLQHTLPHYAGPCISHPVSLSIPILLFTSILSLICSLHSNQGFFFLLLFLTFHFEITTDLQEVAKIIERGPISPPMVTSCTTIV